MKAWPTTNWPTYLQRGDKLVTIIILTLANGTVKRFTDNTENFSVTGISGQFDAVSGGLRTAISMGASLDTSTLDIQLNMNSGQQNITVNPTQAYVTSAINLMDVLAGLYRGAQFQLALTFPDHPTDGFLPMLSGIVGETKIGRNTFKATLESQIFKITVQTPLTTTPSCRNKFGDSNCKFNVSPLIQATTVSAVSDNQHFTVPIVLNNPAVVAAFPEVARIQNAFIFGTVAFTSGANAGLSVEIADITLHVSSTDIKIWLPVGFDVQVGDSVNISPGCSKQRTSCQAYQNVINFDGEPDVVGASMMCSAASLVV